MTKFVDWKVTRDENGHVIRIYPVEYSLDTNGREDGIKTIVKIFNTMDEQDEFVKSIKHKPNLIDIAESSIPVGHPSANRFYN